LKTKVFYILKGFYQAMFLLDFYGCGRRDASCRPVEPYRAPRHAILSSQKEENKRKEDRKNCSIANAYAAACMPPTRPIGHLGRTVVSARKPRLRPPALAPLHRRRREPQPSTAPAPATVHKAVSCRRAPLRRTIVHDTKVLIQSHIVL
jgi:hypothetical protein